jgi:hypothetical protein
MYDLNLVSNKGPFIKKRADNEGMTCGSTEMVVMEMVAYANTNIC